MAGKQPEKLATTQISPYKHCAMSKSFHDPSAILITGASSGIGEALALDYAAPGRCRRASCVFACRSSEGSPMLKKYGEANE